MSIRGAPEARQMAACSSMWLFEEVFKIRGPQSLLFVLFLAKSLSRVMTSFSNISGAGFASVRMGKKNYIGQSTVRYRKI